MNPQPNIENYNRGFNVWGSGGLPPNNYPHIPIWGLILELFRGLASPYMYACLIASFSLRNDISIYTYNKLIFNYVIEEMQDT